MSANADSVNNRDSSPTNLSCSGGLLMGYGPPPCLPRHPTAIGGKRYRHLRKFEHQQELEWCILPETKGPRLSFP